MLVKLFCTLTAFDKATKVLKELDVLLMLHGSAQLNQFISKGVVNPSVSQEVHQVVIQSLWFKSKNSSENALSMSLSFLPRLLTDHMV